MNDKTLERLSKLRKALWKHHKTSRRNMPWRADVEDGGWLDPYRVMVSEIMLQQTQVSRVTKKYPAFLDKFPTVKALAEGSVSDLLHEWQGMGYNRRALFLKRAAEEVYFKRNGIFPQSILELEELPGIGLATAGAIYVYSQNKPAVFIETNIRRIFLHHFFPRSAKVHDKKLLPLIEAAVDQKRPREWYYALMDYGTLLATQVKNPNRRSSHYAKQSQFKGSNREIRGAILKALVREGGMPKGDLIAKSGPKDLRTEANIEKMLKEGFLKDEGGQIMLA